MPINDGLLPLSVVAHGKCLIVASHFKAPFIELLWFILLFTKEAPNFGLKLIPWNKRMGKRNFPILEFNNGIAPLFSLSLLTFVHRTDGLPSSVLRR